MGGESPGQRRIGCAAEGDGKGSWQGGSRQGSRRRDLRHFRVRQEEKEKEEKGKREERQEEIRWEEQCPENAENAFRIHRAGPRCEAKEKAGCPYQEEAEEVQGYQLFGQQFIGDHGGDHHGRGFTARSVKDPESSGSRSRGVGSGGNSDHENICHAEHWRPVASGRELSSAGGHAICPAPFAPEIQRRDEEGDRDVSDRGGLPIDGKGSRSYRYSASKSESPGVDTAGARLGNQPEAGNYPQRGCWGGQPCRAAAGPARSSLGRQIQGWMAVMGKRERKRKVERQGRNAGKRKKQRESQRGRKKELLNEGVKRHKVEEPQETAPGCRESHSNDSLLQNASSSSYNFLCQSDSKSPPVRVDAMPLVDAEGSEKLHFLSHPVCGEAATSPAFLHERASKCDSSGCDGAVDGLGLGQTVRGEKIEAMGDEEFGMKDVFGWLETKLDLFSVSLCKVLPSGRVFPLPSSFLVLGRLFPQTPRPCLVCLRVLVFALNSLNGEGFDDDGTRVSPYQRQVLEGLLLPCQRICDWSERGRRTSWSDFFRIKGVDYKGDEILSAQWLRWENVAPALPLEVGGVALEDVVEKGSRHYVLNFAEYLLDPEDQVSVKPPRVMVDPACWDVFCEKMMERGVFSRVHVDEVYKVQGKPLLNGLFGVSKHEFEGQWEVMRVIMNLVPLNSVCRGLDSDIATLPSWAGMSPLELLSDEDLVVSSEDVRCFFYIFKIPVAWHRFMAFNRPLPERLRGDKPGDWFPCSAVLPMGFKNSVALAQHVHRVIAKQALGTLQLGW